MRKISIVQRNAFPLDGDHRFSHLLQLLERFGASLFTRLVVYQLSCSPSLYCVNSPAFTRPSNENGTLPVFFP